MKNALAFLAVAKTMLTDTEIAELEAIIDINKAELSEDGMVRVVGLYMARKTSDLTEDKETLANLYWA